MLLQTSTPCPTLSMRMSESLTGALIFVGGALITGFLIASSFAHFILILALVGLVGMLEKLSIARCPTGVLAGATAFILLSAVVDAIVF